MAPIRRSSRLAERYDAIESKKRSLKRLEEQIKAEEEQFSDKMKQLEDEIKIKEQVITMFKRKTVRREWMRNSRQATTNINIAQIESLKLQLEEGEKDIAEAEKQAEPTTPQQEAELSETFKQMVRDRMKVKDVDEKLLQQYMKKENVEFEWRSCFICTMEYSRTDKNLHPIILNCGHNLCRSCINKLTGNGIVKCPFDRLDTRVRVTGLPRNLALINL